MTSPDNAQLVEHIRSHQPLHARSLIVTMFGDAIHPHGGVIWLSALIKLAASLGLNERLVRTAVYRLRQEGWLAAETRGRRSIYHLTERGAHAFESADQRIYQAPQTSWDEHWRIVLLHQTTRPQARLGKALSWRGYAQLDSHTFAHPTADLEALSPVLEELGVSNSVSRLVARPASADAQALAARFLGAANLTVLAEHYRSFLNTFEAATRAQTPGPRDAFVLRTLLIHEFRRVLLRDPGLPTALLPAHWPGAAARQLTAQIYAAVLRPAEEFLHTHGEGFDSNMPSGQRAPLAELLRRFKSPREDADIVQYSS
jgi:phenylacetic acid degradation operon negative regulatory protein